MVGRMFWILVGVLSIVGGFFCLLNPIPATLAATSIAAWVLLAVGILQALGSFRQEGFGSKIWSLLLGVLAIFLGYSIFQNPLASVFALTTVVAIALLIGGGAKIFLAFSVDDRSFFWVFLLAGVISIVLSVMILSNFPRSAVTVLGILLGVELLANGASLLAFGFSSAKKETV